MICPTCGTENLANSKFCRECASSLSSGCPNCGFVNQPGAKFCNECATPLAAGAGAAPARSALVAPAGAADAGQGSGAERRLVSILFADLVGFTPFAEGRDSEDVRETLTKYFDLARDVIERYGGTVEKFIGDAVMAVWGAPTAHEDDAERAVRAALELVDAVTGLGSGIQARAGVLTGEAAVTLGATNQGMVAGDLVNTASRLQSVAPPGSVLVGETTQRAASAAITFEPAGDQLLKGKQAPVAAWRALRVVAERGGRNRAEALEAPFVGRQEEMRLLKDLFHATGREKKLRVVSVIGPGGIGKSRLAREFSKYIDGLIDDVYWHSGRSPAYGEGITFWALGEMIRERAGLAEMDDEATTRARITETVERWVTDPEERSWIERSLLTLLGIEGGMAADQLFGAWRTFFERIAQNGTVVMVFEDMHFADTGLLDFVDHLLEWSRGLPIYVVTLARPDLIERRQDWGAGKRNFVSLYLEPLPEEQMRELLAGLVPGLPDGAVATIVARADGIPLYAVETVRTLVAEGKLVQEGDVFVPRGDLTTLSIPETLQALIASRLDTLDPTDRRIVQDAAVLGQSFSAAGLAAVADIAEAELEPRLAGLVRRELMSREMDPRSPERGQYAFVQALIREVAYNTLAKKDRKRLHLSAARFFESLGHDEIAGVLASHYLAAHANSAEGEEADALAGQARIALKAAATRASALGSFDQAVTFAEQALTITTAPADQVDLLIQAAEASRISGRLPRSEEMLRQAVDIANASADGDLVLRAKVRLADMLLMEYKVDEGAAVIDTMGEMREADEAIRAEIAFYRARVHFLRGQYHEALAMLDAPMEIFERRGLVRLVALGLIARANNLWSTSRRREAYGVARAAVEVSAEHGLTDVELRARGNLANAQTETDARASFDTWREQLAVARKFGMRGLLISGTANFGYTAFLAGEWGAALAEMDPLLAEDLAAKDRLVMLSNSLVIHTSRGDSIAEGLADMARAGAEMSGKWELFVYDPEANAAMAAGDMGTAREKFVKIVDTDPGTGLEYMYRAVRAALWSRDLADSRALLARYEEMGDYGPVGDTRKATLTGGVAALEGRTKEALALYRDALAGWRATHSVWDEALTGIDMAELLDPAEPEVAAAINSTREILERLGAKPYLARLDAAVSRIGSAAPTRVARAAAPTEVAISD